MKLPVCREPFPDELFYGYIRSLTVANGMERMSEMEFMYLNGGDDNAHVHVRYPTGLAKICDYVQNRTFPSLRCAFAMTPYYAETVGMSEGKQAKMAEMILQVESPAVPRLRGKEKSRIRICHECWKEDEEKYGEGYLHLSHHLPGVMVCYKHQCCLEEIPSERGRERMLKIVPGIGTELVVSHKKDAVEQAKSMLQTFTDGQFPLTETVCEKCGKSYMEHPYSKRTVCGCPYCNENQPPEKIINRRLKKRFGEEYAVKPGFTAQHTATVVHNPCKAERKQLGELLYGEWAYCKECTKLVPEYLKRRFDPEERNWIFSESSKEQRKRKRMHVKHRVCGRVSYLTTGQFLKKEGGYCPYCDNPKNRVDITEIDSEYEIVGRYQNNHDEICIRHKTCGFDFISTKSAFLHGKRCPVCSPRYVFADIAEAVSACTQGYVVMKEQKGGYVSLKCPDGRVLEHLSFKEIVNDLQSEHSAIFYDKRHRYIEKQSVRRKIYDAVKSQTKRKGYWTFADGLEEKTVNYRYKRRIQDMTRLGIIKCIGEDKYIVEVNEYDTNIGKTDS